MNYIKRLEKENATYRRMIAAVEAEIVDVFRYLQSEKFHEDTTVQGADVMRRLENVTGAAYEAQGERNDTE